MKDWIEEYKSQTLLRVYLQPGASKNEVYREYGEYGDPVRLKIKIKSPPIDGKANKGLIDFLAKTLNIRKSEIVFLRGELSRSKDLIVDAPPCDVYLLLDSLF
jgi:uncharacterized protein (TIGR00251 family)